MDFLALILAIIAIILVLRLRKRIADFQQQLTILDQRLTTRGLRTPPETQTAPTPETPPTLGPLTPPEPPPLPAPVEQMDEAAIDKLIAETAPPSTPPAPPPAQPARSFEERFGASWVVWI